MDDQMKSTIVGAIAEIIINNYEKLSDEYKSKGGYEGWLQVELAQWFRNKKYTVEREKPYHYRENNIRAKRCDIVLTNVLPNVYIELKAGTRKRVTPNHLVDDADKIAGLMRSGECGYAIRISKDVATLPRVTAGNTIHDVIYCVDREGYTPCNGIQEWVQGCFFITILKIESIRR